MFLFKVGELIILCKYKINKMQPVFVLCYVVIIEKDVSIKYKNCNRSIA